MTPLRQRICAALFGACLTLCALVAPAAHADGAAPAAAPKTPAWLAPKSASKPPQVGAGAPRMGLGRSLIALLSVSVLGGTALYLRSKKKNAPKARLAQLRVVGATKLGGRAQLVLAEVNGRQILLGVTDASVRKLGWMDSEAAEEEEELSSARPRLMAAGTELGARQARTVVEAAPAPAPKRTFRDLLASAVGNLGSRPDDDSAALTLAAETQDTFTRTAPRTAEKRSVEAPRKNGNPQMIDLEGQAKGLLARLGEPRG
jgi:flagellar biogenesis protein FliO